MRKLSLREGLKQHLRALVAELELCLVFLLDMYFSILCKSYCHPWICSFPHPRTQCNSRSWRFHLLTMSWVCPLLSMAIAHVLAACPPPPPAPHRSLEQGRVGLCMVWFQFSWLGHNPESTAFIHMENLSSHHTCYAYFMEHLCG